MATPQYAPIFLRHAHSLLERSEMPNIPVTTNMRGARNFNRSAVRLACLALFGCLHGVCSHISFYLTYGRKRTGFDVLIDECNCHALQGFLRAGLKNVEGIVFLMEALARTLKQTQAGLCKTLDGLLKASLQNAS